MLVTIEVPGYVVLAGLAIIVVGALAAQAMGGTATMLAFLGGITAPLRALADFARGREG